MVGAHPSRHRWLALAGLTVVCVLVHGLIFKVWTGPMPAALVAAQGPAPAAVLTRFIVEARALQPAAPLTQVVRLAAVAPARAANRSRDDATPAADAAAPLLSQAFHLPSDALDIGPMPKSSPDERYVEEVHRSGLPILVRLFVESDGVVSSAQVLSNAPGDETAAQSVVAMFRDTAFIPGRLAGRDVAAYIDIEIVLEPTLPEVIPLAHF